jgi:hypothetical protein
MEILGRSIPNLQNAIATGLESVTAGIAESTKVSGAMALGIAKQSFSFKQMETRNAVDLRAVSGAAEYPDPKQYFRQLSGTTSRSPVSSLDIARTLTDVQFSPEKSLQTLCSARLRVHGSEERRSNHTIDIFDPNGRVYFTRSLNDPEFRLDSALSPQLREDMQNLLRPNSLEEQMKAFVEKKQKQIERKMFDMMHPKTYRVLDVEDRRSETDVTHPSMDGTIHVSEREGGQSVEGAAGGTSNDASNRSIIVVGGKAGDASDRSIIVVGGKAEDASDRSIIVVGGKTEDASDRSIIVVGGKTSDTYFQTIDDSLNQLRQNPTQQTADLFTQQSGAVQDLLMTARSTVQLQENIGSNLLSRDMRI